MGYLEAAIISFLFQLPLGFFAAFKAPLRGQLGGIAERARIATIVFAFVPIPFFSIMLQLGWLAIYMSKAKYVEHKTNKVESQWAQSQPASSAGGNPFGGAGSGEAVERPSASTGTNPFGDATSGKEGGGRSEADRPGDNPFA